jgi:pimeloyl-ACP methyl ester carboxylesterase
VTTADAVRPFQIHVPEEDLVDLRRRIAAARIYWELGRLITAAAGQQPPPMALPAAYSVFPGELVRPPRSWLEQVYPNLVYFHEADKGGHFAAWEEPEVFAAELRAAFRSLR